MSHSFFISYLSVWLSGLCLLTPITLSIYILLAVSVPQLINYCLYGTKSLLLLVVWLIIFSALVIQHILSDFFSFHIFIPSLFYIFPVTNSLPHREIWIWSDFLIFWQNQQVHVWIERKEQKKEQLQPPRLNALSRESWRFSLKLKHLQLRRSFTCLPLFMSLYAFEIPLDVAFCLIWKH